LDDKPGPKPVIYVVYYTLNGDQPYTTGCGTAYREPLQVVVWKALQPLQVVVAPDENHKG